MTPDDTPIPEDDAIAAAARRALHRLASSGATQPTAWAEVQTGARRVQRRRVAAAVAACAIVLGVAGAAAAVAGSDNGVRGSHTAAEAATTTETTSTIASSTTTTSTTAPVSPISSPGATTPTAPLASAVQPGDLQGTLVLASTALVTEQPASFTLTIQNTSGHAVSFPSSTVLGVSLDAVGVSALNDAGAQNITLAPGEQRSFTSSITPPPESVGAASVQAVLYDPVPTVVPQQLTNIAPVAVTIAPPGWVAGQPLDPAQGQWSATMTADATQVTAGQQIAVHASVTNTGTQPQNTEGYGSLAIVCHGSGIPEQGRFIDNVTLAPGEEQTFTIDFTPTDASAGDVMCTLGIAFHGDADGAGARQGIDSDAVTIAVLPEPGASTTTTFPGVTTSTTTP